MKIQKIYEMLTEATPQWPTITLAQIKKDYGSSVYKETKRFYDAAMDLNHWGIVFDSSTKKSMPVNVDQAKLVGKGSYIVLK